MTTIKTPAEKSPAFPEIEAARARFAVLRSSADSRFAKAKRSPEATARLGLDRKIQGSPDAMRG